MTGLDAYCVGHGRRPPHVPDGGLTVARVTPYGAAVRLCRDCFQAWVAEDREDDQ